MPEYNFLTMPLKELCTVLIDRGYTFEQLREMNSVELSKAVDLVNSGDLRTLAEVAAARKAALTTPAAAPSTVARQLRKLKNQ